MLHAANERPEEAKKLLDDAYKIGGQQARQTAAQYPALKDLL